MPRTHAEDGICLRTENPADRVALRGVRLLGRLSGMSLRATLEQTFVNLEDRAIEAVYTFPLPENAAVCGFEVVTADRVLTGTIEENEAAEEKYDQALGAGHGAFMAEQHRPDVFTVRVGNLKPKQAATIRLTYVMPLERVDKQIRVGLPTTIAPRYATATATDPIDAMIDGDALNPPHVLSVPYGLSMRLEIDLGRELAGVFSPSHAINVSHSAHAAHGAHGAHAHGSAVGPTAERWASGNVAPTTVVTLAGAITEMNRDVVLTLQLVKEAEPTVQSAVGPDGATYLAVTFAPEFSEDDLGDPRPAETIFVLDCSGSMMGDSIQQARAALELCLRSLSPGDTFNICRFGSTFELMASEPLVYSEATLKQALAYVRQRADLGGTELFAPLDAIFKQAPSAGAPNRTAVRQVILLTDGQVTNEPAVVELARKHRAHNRVFTFGIGAAASAFLVRGIARATGGAVEFITVGERIEDKVLRTFARLALPMAEAVSLDWQDAEVQTLAEIPPIFDGDLLAVYARCNGTPPKQVTLSCRVGDREHRWPVAVPAFATNDENTIATMWARRTIQSLEEVAGQAVRSRKKKLTREQETIVRLSKEFNLLSSRTTFIAIEHRSPAERNAGNPATRRVPVMLAEGWGDVDAMMVAGAMPPMAMAAMPAGGGVTCDRSAPSPAAPPQAAFTSRGGGLRSLFGRLTGGPAKKREAPDDETSAELHSLDRTLDRSMDRSTVCSIDKSMSIDQTIHEPPIDRLLNELVASGCREGAEQLSIEPMQDRVQVRFCKAGKWEVRDRMPMKIWRHLEKVIRERSNASADIAGGTGSFEIVVDGGRVQVHVASMPSTHGQVFTLRLAGERPTAEPLADVPALRQLLSLQSADGWFDWSDDAANLVYSFGRGWKKHVEAVVKQEMDPAQRERTIHTVLVLLLLATKFEPWSVLWKRAATKATKLYLAKALGLSPADAEAWVANLRQQLAP